MKNNKFLASLSALVGALIFSIPWIFIYYLGYIASICAFIIGYGAYLFYKKVCDIDSKAKYIIVTISVIVITFITFIVMPFMTAYLEGTTFNALYANDAFVTALVKDYIVSLIFTILGISTLLKKMNEEAKTDNTLTEEEKIKKLKSVYQKYNALDKEHTISEITVLKELDFADKLPFLTKMEKKGIIVSPFKKSYFDEEALTNEDKAKANFKKNIMPGIIISIVIVLASILAGIYLAYNSTEVQPRNITEKKETTVTFENVTLNLTSNFIKTETDTESVFYENQLNEKVGGIMIVKLKSEYDGDLEKFYKSYRQELKKTYNILEIKDETYNGVDYKMFKMQYLEDENEKDIYYVTQLENNFYLIGIFSNFTDNDWTEAINFSSKLLASTKINLENKQVDM